MLIGSNGYEYPAYTYNRSTHRDATEDGCVDCHMKRATSNNVVGGHSFNMRGIIRTEAGDEEEIVNVAACADCHGDVPDFNIGNVQSDIDALAEELATILQGAGLWTGSAPASVTTSADSAGAVWNLLMIEEDRSHGVHNPKYAMGLLESAIQFLEPGPDPIAKTSEPASTDLVNR